MFWHWSSGCRTFISHLAWIQEEEPGHAEAVPAARAVVARAVVNFI
jgi:hypothetical protein